MKHLLPTITWILISFLFINCGNEDSEQEQVIFEDINKLSEDPLFLDYLKKESDATKRIVDLRIANDLYQNLNNLTDLEKEELAGSLGYIDFDAMKNHIVEKSEMAFQLNEKYKFSQQDEAIFREIILSTINEYLLFPQIGSNSLNQRSLIANNDDECLISGLKLELEGNLLCGLVNSSYILSWAGLLESNLIGEPCDFLTPDRIHLFPCAVQNDLDYYIVSYDSWIAIACCISGHMHSLDCPTNVDWCSNYPCC